MRTDQERIALLHRRAAQLKRQEEKKALALWGSVSVFLFMLLTAFTVRMTALPRTPGGGDYTGASLLAESTGGYVLAAVIAFMAGVIITVVIVKKQKNRKDKS